jgi:uncharacterized membrane protein
MTWYTFFKSLHVLAAVVWVGGASVVQLYALRALADRDPHRQATFAKDTEVIGMRTFVPASLVVILAAIGMMVNAHLSWGMDWTVFGLIVFAASFAVGAGFLGPESGRLAKLIEEHGAAHPEVSARIRRILMVSRIELVFLLAVVWNMVVKPSGSAGWFWGALVVTFVVAVGVFAQYQRSAPAVGVAATE